MTAKRVHIGGMPTMAENESVSDSFLSGHFWKFPRRLIKRKRITGLELAGARKFVGLECYSPWWVRPCYGDKEYHFDFEVQYLLWHRSDGKYGVALPLIDGDLRAFFRSDKRGLTLEWSGALAGAEPASADLLFTAVGSDPYKLTEQAVRIVADRLKTFRMRTEKRIPAFVEYLGWCTWNAFYENVTPGKVLGGIRSFREGGINLKFVILDCGWQDSTDKKLNSFGANAGFPGGLRPLIEKAGKKFETEIFGVWHTLQGYWDGINPRGELAKQFDLISTRRGDGVSLVLVHPGEAHRFYQEYHSRLRSEGVDMVKVDYQSSLAAFTRGKLGQVSAMRAYQQAMQGSCHTHFEGNLLNSMSNGSDVAYNMTSSVVWRNSDDFFPERPESHQFHVHANAMNNLWSRTFALPDWDMFQSHHAAAGFHAAARAISGGPIYVADKPRRQNFALLKKLCTSDGRILRCEEPALPAKDCLFVNCYKEPHLLKITNRNGPIGLLGVFHCTHSDEPISGRWSASDIRGLKGSCFAVYAHNSGRLVCLRRTERQDITLPSLGCELLTLSPVTNGIAPLGLLDKLNGSRALDSYGFEHDGSYTARLRDGGKIGFFVQKRPSCVKVNARRVRFSYGRNKLLRISTRTGRPVTVNLMLNS